MMKGCLLWWTGAFLAGYVTVLLLDLSRWWSIPIALGAGTAVCFYRTIALRSSRPIATGHRCGPPSANASSGPPSWRVILHATTTEPSTTTRREHTAAARWRRHDGLYWLDIPGGGDPEAVWRQARRDCPFSFADATLTGIVVLTDAATLLEGKPVNLPGGALAALERFAASAPSPLAVHLLVGGIDRLYGMASFAKRIPTARRTTPLGIACRTPGRRAGDTVRHILSSLADQVLSLALPNDGQPRPECLQVACEIMRLAEPLARLAGQFFRGKGAGNAHFAGLFLFAAGRGGDAVAPRLVRPEHYRTESEATGRKQPLFADHLLDRLAGTAKTDAGGRAPCRRHPGWVKYLPAAACLLFCAMVIGTVLESRSILRSVSGVAAPSCADELEGFHSFAVRARQQCQTTRFPRFGLDHPVRLAATLESGFAEAFHTLRILPDLDQLQDDALMAARSRNPQAIGESLLQLTAYQDRLARLQDTGEYRGGGPADRMLRALDLIAPSDLRQLDAYLRWTGPQEWMPAVHQTLEQFQTYLMTRAEAGGMGWLPAWIDRLPFVDAVETHVVWGGSRQPFPPPASRIAPAWTAEGYRFAKEFLTSLPTRGDESAWRTACRDFLVSYRDVALRQWLAAAEALWEGGWERVADDGVRFHLDRSASGDDPVSGFIALALRHLLPIFDGEEHPPAIRWLCLRAGQDAGTEAAGGADAPARVPPLRELDESLDRIRDLCATPDENLSVIRTAFRDHAVVGAGGRSDPYSRAREYAAAVDAHMRHLSGGFAWDALSATAQVEFLRYLGVRLAAETLDGAWREEVYLPSRLVPGDEAETVTTLAGREGILHRFLGNAAAGLWTWESGTMGRAAWDGLTFPLADDFLRWSGDFLRNGFAGPPLTRAMPFRIHSVSVDPGARERPVEVEFLLRTGEEVQRVAFRNVAMPSQFAVTRTRPDAACIRLHFPASVVSLTLDGPGAFEEFLALFPAGGECLLPAELFDDPEALRRRGISRVVIRASLDNTEAALAFVRSRPAVPPSIIAPANFRRERSAPPLTGIQATSMVEQNRVPSPSTRVAGEISDPPPPPTGKG